MKAKRSDLRKLRAKTCQVTLGGDGGSVTFDIQYVQNIPPTLYVSLMEVAQIGEDFKRVGEQVGDTTGLSENEVSARVRESKDTLSGIRDRLVELASLLAEVVISQEYLDDDDKPIKPDYEYFSACDLEDQLAYANAIIVDKQHPTTPSATTQQDTSSAEGLKDIPPSSIVASEPPSSQTSPLTDSTTQIQ
jgi:hypothetical protein